MPLSNKEKQAAFRKRNADLGRSELRGIWVTNEEEIVIKKKVRAMINKMRCPS